MGLPELGTNPSRCSLRHTPLNCLHTALRHAQPTIAMLLYSLCLGVFALRTVGAKAWRSSTSRKSKAAEMSDGADSPAPTHDSGSAPAGRPHQGESGCLQACRLLGGQL